MTDLGEFTLMSRVQGLGWCVHDRCVRNGASAMELWFLAFFHQIPCTYGLYLGKKAKIWTSRSGSGSKEKVKNRKAKDLEDWQRKYRSEQAQNRVGDKAEKERGCEAVEGRIYLTQSNTVCQCLYLLKLIQYSWWYMEIIVEERGTLRVWDFSFQLCLFKWTGNPAMW